MSAYKTAIDKPQCSRCSRPATHFVFNARNARCGAYCAKCADKRVKELNAADRAVG